MKKEQTTPLMRQYQEIKNKHADKLILFRMGDFYETFFDDAKIASSVLGIALTSRNKNEEKPIPLAGFPYHALDTYLDKLVKAGYKVAICEQVEDPKLAIGLVKREIVEIITPGAILDDSLLEGHRNNFLTSIIANENKTLFGLSSIDISTGDFSFTEINKNSLQSEINRLQPSEILIPNEETKQYLEHLNFENKLSYTVFDSYSFLFQEAQQIIKKHFSAISLEGFGGQNKPLGVSAAGAALAYVKELRNDNLSHITQLSYYSIDSFMLLDEVSIRNLELLKSIRFNTKQGSLLSVIDQTLTPMGSRLLINWLLHPLLDIQQIQNRLLSVEACLQDMSTTMDIRVLLQDIGDVSRILSKVATLRATPRDLLALSGYLSKAPVLLNYLKAIGSTFLYNPQLDSDYDYSIIERKIHDTLQENPSLTITEGNIIKEGVNSELDELRLMSKEGKTWIARLEDAEKQKTGISSLKINYNKVFGYYIEITKSNLDKVPDYYIRKQTLVNAERYISPQLKEYETKVLGAEERIKSIEYELYQELRTWLSEQIQFLQQYVSLVAIVDVITSFAYNAHYYHYTKPQFNDMGILEIKECRHPVIERLLSNNEYIPNDVFLNNEDFKIILLTGPNMAGKSTYLRQIGLLVIMAQIGSYIPARSALLPIFDKVFTRVGASDNLAMGQSTFLVEMIETANILNSATNQSLILLDEIGRGTSTFDGLSLAWAIVEFIHNTKKISAKTLFATHYHELTELENLLPGVKNYNILVREWNDQIIFLRKIERGGADQSYGIQVARLAGVPDKVIRKAKQILKNLEEMEISAQGLQARVKRQLRKDSEQIDLFEVIIEQSEKKDELVNTLKDILLGLNINELSPINAFQILSELKALVKKDDSLT